MLGFNQPLPVESIGFRKRLSTKNRKSFFSKIGRVMVVSGKKFNEQKILVGTKTVSFFFKKKLSQCRKTSERYPFAFKKLWVPKNFGKLNGVSTISVRVSHCRKISEVDF